MAPRVAYPSRHRGNTLIGMFIGLALGLAIAALIAFYLGRLGSAPVQPGPSKDATKTAKADTPATTEKPRFDFYKILPGGEDTRNGGDRKAQSDKPAEKAADKATDKATDKPLAKAAAEPGKDAAPAKSSDQYWIQVGSFINQGDAEDTKARLAFSGWEASVQTANLPDKGQRYRVRIGPYDNTDELNRVKAELSKKGFDVAVIRGSDTPDR